MYSNKKQPAKFQYINLLALFLSKGIFIETCYFLNKAKLSFMKSYLLKQLLPKTRHLSQLTT